MTTEVSHSKHGSSARRGPRPRIVRTGLLTLVLAASFLLVLRIVLVDLFQVL